MLAFQPVSTLRLRLRLSARRPTGGFQHVSKGVDAETAVREEQILPAGFAVYVRATPFEEKLKC
jgi:hypothetical protein